MSNKVLSKELAILKNCKVDSINVVDILKSAKGKRGRKSAAEADDETLYNYYKDNCNRQCRPALDFKAWTKMHELYEFDELLSTQDVENNNPRFWKESKADKCGYIGEELDYEACDNLYAVLFKALNKRLVILLNLESVPGMLNTAYACRYNGNDCKNINLALNAKLNEIRKLLNDKEFSSWIKSGVSDMSLYSSANMISDYVETYQKVIRQITDIRDMSLDYIKDIIHNDLDLFEDMILVNDIPEVQAYYEDNLDLDESEAEYEAEQDILD